MSKFKKISVYYNIILRSRISKKIGRKAKLDYQQNENLLAGLRVSAEDLQFDATIDHQLNKFKQSISGD